jgi:hypothetical protein
MVRPIVTHGLTIWRPFTAAAASVTHETKDGRSVCRNLDQLDDVPELHDFDTELLRIVTIFHLSQGARPDSR